MKQNQKSTRNGVQDILFPMEYMNITQGNNGQYSHQGVNALDLAGRDGGRDLFYAPFDVECMATDSPQNGNAVFWQSSAKVRFADGTVDYATIMIIHDNSLGGIYKGVCYTQGTQIAQEGTAGNATGNHNHFEIAKGKYSHMYNLNGQGVYSLPNSISADKACFIDGTNVINGNGMSWKKLSDVSTAPKPSAPSGWVRTPENATFTLTVDKINFRNEPTTKSAVQGYYEKGMSVNYDSKIDYEGFVWVSWVSASSGTRRYMAVREIATNRPYGTFK